MAQEKFTIEKIDRDNKFTVLNDELIKEQLICKVENNLTEAIKAAKMANLSTEPALILLFVLL